MWTHVNGVIFFLVIYYMYMI